MQTETRLHAVGHRAAAATLGLAVAAIAVHWGWNNGAAALFGLPEARFVQSLAGLCALGAAAAVAGCGLRLGWRRGAGVYSSGSGLTERQSDRTTK